MNVRRILRNFVSWIAYFISKIKKITFGKYSYSAYKVQKTLRINQEKFIKHYIKRDCESVTILQSLFL